jgi:pimeloyl-ACP methyl ester carboxylesterase
VKKWGYVIGLITIIATLCVAVLPAGCGNNNTASQGPDYSNEANWLALPSSPGDKAVDVFFLYPSGYGQSSPDDPMICAIDNPQMQANAKSAYSRTATAFETVADIYAPYYEQAALQVLSMPLDQQQAIVGGQPTADAISAFDYYIKHYNKGRPFILAGHSQGSNILINLMADYMQKNPDVYQRMVAAYVPGYSITPQYLQDNPELKFATGADDTGVIISYNTVAPTTTEPDPVVLPGAMVINPITWTTDQTLATAAQNLGSIELDSNGYPVLDDDGNPRRVLNYADAQIDSDRGELICSTVDPNTLAPGNEMVAAGIYHSFDYPFYYFDLRENAAIRIAHFLAEY